MASISPTNSEIAQNIVRDSCSGILVEPLKTLVIGGYNRSASQFIKRFLQQLEAYISNTEGSSTLRRIKSYEELKLFFDSYDVYTVCRNPVTRAFSAWVETVFSKVTADPELYNHYSIYLSELSVTAIKTCFERFIFDICKRTDLSLSLFSSNKHWMLQKDLLLVEDIPYKKIVRFEELDTFLQSLASAAKISNEFFLEEQFPLLKGPIPYHQKYISQEALEQLAVLYAADFEYFNYPIEAPTVETFIAPNIGYLNMSLSERKEYVEAQHIIELQEKHRVRRLQREAERVESDRLKAIEAEQEYIKSIIEEAEGSEE